MDIVLLDRIADFKQIKEIWRHLSAEESSYFLSWGWVENWIESLPKDVKVDLAMMREGNIPALAFFLGRAEISRKKVLRSKALFLNVAGHPVYDALCPEYNSILHSRILSPNLKDVLDLLPNQWEEFVMPALDSQSFPGNSLKGSFGPYHVLIEEEKISPFVNLDLVRKKEGGYLSLLTANMRNQIRRAYKNLNLKGSVCTEVAKDIVSALRIYEEMVGLHTKTWRARRKAGAFESDYFFEFHKKLIQKRFAEGEIQLIRVAVGAVTLGCLYNFVYRGRAYFYQSGINYEAGVDKPGILCHVEAVNHNAEIGNREYDFLGGADRYKVSLSTDQRRLVWARFQKPSTKFWLEHKGKAVKRMLSNFFQGLVC